MAVYMLVFERFVCGLSKISNFVVQIKHMWKHKYIPFSFGKQTYSGASVKKEQGGVVAGRSAAVSSGIVAHLPVARKISE